jgi:hypothetical protein
VTPTFHASDGRAWYDTPSQPKESARRRASVAIRYNIYRLEFQVKLRSILLSLMAACAVGLGTTAAMAVPASAAAAAPSAARVRLDVYGCNYARPPYPQISEGAGGAAVKQAQCLLLFAGFSVGPSGIDGSFGPDTKAAVLAFQRSGGLHIDGIVGPQTWFWLTNQG